MTIPDILDSLAVAQRTHIATNLRFDNTDIYCFRTCCFEAPVSQTSGESLPILHALARLVGFGGHHVTAL